MSDGFACDWRWSLPRRVADTASAALRPAFRHPSASGRAARESIG